MPNKKPTIFQKLRICYWLMTDVLNLGLIQECGICGSVNIVGSQTKGNKLIYRAKYKCLSCGSRANVKEKWRATRNA